VNSVLEVKTMGENSQMVNGVFKKRVSRVFVFNKNKKQSVKQELLLWGPHFLFFIYENMF
jgi:hypothetical protein